MKRWIVYTPQFEYTEPVLDDGSGPRMLGCDQIEIEADTKRDAITLGVKAMLEDHRQYSYCHDQRSDRLCPFTGVRAEPYDLADVDFFPDNDCGGYRQ